MAKLQNGVETVPKISTGWVGCANVTDDRRIYDSIYSNVTSHVQVIKMSYFM